MEQMHNAATNDFITRLVDAYCDAIRDEVNALLAVDGSSALAGSALGLIGAQDAKTFGGVAAGLRLALSEFLCVSMAPVSVTTCNNIIDLWIEARRAGRSIRF